MPELPEVELVRRTLAPTLERARIARVIIRRSGLRRPFPPNLATQVAGATVTGLGRRGKYLLADLSIGSTLVLHLGMSGWIRIESAGYEPDSHDHVVLVLTSGKEVVFRDPRRFGLLDLVPSAELPRWPAFAALGPEPLSPEFDAAALARACAGSRRSVKVALLDQRVVAGVGNIYASEALHVARLSPRRRALTLATSHGLPSLAAQRLSAAVKRVLAGAVAQLQRDADRQRFRVYERAAERCPRRACPGRIRRLVQAGRSTFYCPECQR
jgi:formamidopyrimidine-DNA glycosylase